MSASRTELAPANPWLWAMANACWWGAMIAGHYGELGLAVIWTYWAYRCSCDMCPDIVEFAPAYERRCRWVRVEREEVST